MILLKIHAGKRVVYLFHVSRIAGQLFDRSVQNALQLVMKGGSVKRFLNKMQTLGQNPLLIDDLGRIARHEQHPDIRPQLDDPA